MPLPTRTTVKNGPANKMAKNITKYTFVMCLLAIVVIFAFYQIKSRNKPTTQTTVSTEVSKLIDKDLETAYPGTPAEVMKLFGRFNKCVYNTKDITDEEYVKLVEQMRLMFSSKLQELNPTESYLQALKNEASQFEEEEKRMINYTVDKSSSIQYKEIQGQECAYVKVEYFISVSSDFTKTHMVYILVKEDNKWKILAFRQDPEETIGNEGGNEGEGSEEEEASNEN